MDRKFVRRVDEIDDVLKSVKFALNDFIESAKLEKETTEKDLDTIRSDMLQLKNTLLAEAHQSILATVQATVHAALDGLKGELHAFIADQVKQAAHSTVTDVAAVVSTLVPPKPADSEDGVERQEVSDSAIA